MSTFRFKQFAIQHDKATMKVGTDGVLLGAWVYVEGKNQILDVGTGSGVIALMLAQRTSSRVYVDGIELEEQDSEQAIENVKASPWPDKVKIYHTSFQDFMPHKKYDCVVSNPPFFNNSQKPPDSKRVQTRHTTTLPFDELIIHTKRLLSPTGTLNVILPYVEGLEFVALAFRHQLYCTRQWSFRTREEKPIERWLLEFSQAPCAMDTGEILLYSKGDEWSDCYRNLTRDFYLKL
jgi:tRNA1Val (adenine37-N6)-methyltransferase